MRDASGKSENKPSVKVLLTFDFEEWEGRYAVYEADLNGKTERVVDLLNKRKLPATFFLDAGTTLRYPEAARLLNQKEFELAVHSDYHFGAVRDQNSRLKARALNVPDFRQGSEIQISRIRNAVRMIRQVIPSFKPVGFRAPGLRWNENLYLSLKKLGFLYDSSQKADVFQPFCKGEIIVIPVNCGDYDSAVYQMRSLYVLNVWRDQFSKAYRDSHNNGESFFLLLAHPSVSGKHKYIGLLKSILNVISWSNAEYLTCRDLASRFECS